ncbi:Cache type 2 domain protein [Solidesulfovibrio carbinoliphilus subsp. oakridgensis]|uniref:Cache type 2 domain protein n=1 Tax=Solidesulfovibrio carbinoliphilus subsp. oakridgensis TaxID=694327 RepID=G7Q506_9BACT|nr:cache domain-containing protein [Solidesulfovibrio carbinoliphilus]EHJ47933.1 Cache type 2 domain protein [Solidesulfovibrio carbinoliphilus subsp. oakridgensis]
MKRLPLVWLCLVLCCLLPAAALAEERGSKEEAMAMVQKAVAAIKADGQEKTFAAISDSKGPFVDRDLYVVVYDLHGKCLAHGANAKQIGRDLTELRDPDGKFFIKERIELGKAKDNFWQDYKYLNPMTKLIEPKSMYMEKTGDLLVGCGIYKP